MINSEKFHFKSLDAIRTIAFLSTFLAHSFNTDNFEILNSPIYKIILNIRSYFGFGVPVFFVLSGFLISFLMLKNQENNGFTLKGFYFKRILRIWPVYYVVIIFGFFIFPQIREFFLNEPTIENARLWMYVIFLSNFDQINNGVLPFGVGLGPTWSVSIEEQFYLFWPLNLILFPKRKFIFGILFILSLSLYFSLTLNLSGSHTLLSMIYLSVGSLFGYFSYYNLFNMNQKIGNLKWYSVLSIFLLSLLAFWSNSIDKPISVLLFSFGLGVFIIFQCYGQNLSLSKIRILESNGKYTYGLYLYHSIAIFLVSSIFRHLLKLNDNYLIVLSLIPAFSLILSFFISKMSYYYFEVFFLKMKEKIS